MVNVWNFVRRWWWGCLFIGMISGWSVAWGAAPLPPVDPGIVQKVRELQDCVKKIQFFCDIVMTNQDRYFVARADGLPIAESVRDLGTFAVGLKTKFAAIIADQWGADPKGFLRELCGSIEAEVLVLLGRIEAEERRVGGSLNRDAYCTFIFNPEGDRFGVPAFDDEAINSYAAARGGHDVPSMHLGETYYWLMKNGLQLGIESSPNERRLDANSVDALCPVQAIVDMYFNGAVRSLAPLIDRLPEKKADAIREVRIIFAELRGHLVAPAPVRDEKLEAMQKIGRFVAYRGRLIAAKPQGYAAKYPALLDLSNVPDYDLANKRFIAFIDAVDQAGKELVGLSSGDVVAYCRQATTAHPAPPPAPRKPTRDPGKPPRYVAPPTLPKPPTPVVVPDAREPEPTGATPSVAERKKAFSHPAVPPTGGVAKAPSRGQTVPPPPPPPAGNKLNDLKAVVEKLQHQLQAVSVKLGQLKAPPPPPSSK